MATKEGKNVEVVVESPSKHLWTLLTGKTVLASFEVVHDELKRNCNKIITGLKAFQTLKPAEVEAYKKKINETTSLSPKDRLRRALVEKMKLEEEYAFNLFLTYIMFEYKGSPVSYETLVESEKDLKNFLVSLEKFYLNERLCLIYCSQLILKYAVQEDHPYTEILASFVQAACMEDWLKWMAASIDEALNDKEVVEVLHTLSSILYYMGRCENVLTSAVTHLDNYNWSPRSKSKDIVQAEAVLCYSLLQAGDTTTDADNEAIKSFLEKNITELLENPYVLASLLQCIKTRFPNNKVIRTKLQGASNPSKTAFFTNELVNAYSLDGFKNKHGISSVVIPCVNAAVQFILSSYVRENFGSNNHWYTLVESLLKDPQVANDFVHDNCEEYLQVYSETVMSFPIFIHSMINTWKSIFLAVSASDFTSVDILTSAIEDVRWLAEIFDQIDPRLLKPNGSNEWILLRDRNVCGIPIKANSIGTTLDDRIPLVICWPLSPSQQINVWKIILKEVLLPIIQATDAGDPYALEQNEEQLCALAEFLVIYSGVAQKISSEMLSIFKPLSYLLQTQASVKSNPTGRSSLIGLVLRLLAGGAKFDKSILTSQMYEFWPLSPEPNLVGKIIIGFESVTSQGYAVTKSFLQSLLRLMDIPIKDGGDHVRQICLSSIWFVLENIFPSYEHWGICHTAEKNVIIKDCLNIFLKLYRSVDPEYLELKKLSVAGLMDKTSSLYAILKTDSHLLQDSIIRPNADTVMLPDIMIATLSLLMEIHNFKKDVLKSVDSTLALELIQKLGQLCRHRLLSRVPTLAIQFLKNIAAESTVSVLACLHTDAESFRDLVLQRLEYKSEDINLKVGILEFLGVCAHTQLGLVQHFFEEANFVDRLMELFTEQDENLSIALLGFVRALFRRGASTIKNYKGNIWSYIFDPIKRLKPESRLELVTRTMNIITFELFVNGTAEQNFSTEITNLLKEEEFKHIITVCFESKDIDKAKTLVSIKQFFVILTSGIELTNLMPKDTREMLITLLGKNITDSEKVGSDGNSGGTYAELLLHLAPWDDQEFFKQFISQVSPSFERNVIALQKPLLALMIHCIRHSKSTIEPTTIGHLVHIVSRIFFKSAQVYESDQPEIVYPILALAANIVTSIINSTKCLEWTSTFHSNFLVMAVVNVASIGILKGKGPEIVAECLGVLIQLCTKNNCNVLAYTSLSKYLWLPLGKFATTDLQDPKWNDVYLLGVHLNTRMINNLKFHYLEECLNFWGLHGLYLTHKLWDLADIVDRFFLKHPEKNFREMKDLLEVIVFTLDGVAAMIPFIQQWRLQQPHPLTQVLEGVFTTLRTSAALLSQPNHLLFLISSSKSQGNLEPKLTPQILEIQTKLWEVMGLGIEIFWKLRNFPYEYDFVEPGIFMTTIYSVVDLCVKGLTKGDKKSSLSVNIKSVVSITLEKSLVIVFYRGKELLKIIQLNPKDEKSLKRELEAETIAVCDNVKRLGLSNNDFLLGVCSALEDMFK